MQRILTGLALGIVATLLLAGGAFAATGGTFVLGRNNAASSQTLLTNSNATSPVLALSTRSGQVPLAVSTNSGKATNLNADRLDGLNSSDLQLRVTSTCAPGSAIGSIDATGGAACQSTKDAAIQVFTGAMTDGAGLARCPAGTFAIGGGVVPNRASGKAALLYSSVFLSSDGTSGWQAAAEALQGSGYDGTGTVAVSCSSNVQIMAPQASLRKAP